jgi:hypothetical protein
MRGEPSVVLDERRRDRRRPCRKRLPCQLVRIAEKGTWSAMVRDISSEGVGLMTSRAVRPGMFLTVELPLRLGQPAQAKLVRVLHVRPQPGQPWWLVGGTFLQRLGREELDAVRCRTPSIAPPAERRRAVRHSTRLRTPCRLLQVTEVGPWPATVCDVSERGLGLSTARPFKPGMLLLVQLPTAGGQPRQFRVIHARVQPGSSAWLLGGCMLQTLSPEELGGLI